MFIHRVCGNFIKLFIMLITLSKINGRLINYKYDNCLLHRFKLWVRLGLEIVKPFHKINIDWRIFKNFVDNFYERFTINVCNQTFGINLKI